MVSTEWMDQLLHNLGRDAEERARNKLGMYQPPENILGYQFPGWEQLSEKYKTWKMAKVGMENPGILRGMMQSSIRSYVMPQVNEVVIGTSEDYAYWFELGTRSMQPRPFLAPAVLEAVRDWTRLAYKEGFLETGAEYEGMAEIGSVGDETVRFTQGPMAEAVAELKRVMAGENIPGAERTRQFMPVVVERVFPGVEDWRWPHGVPERDLPPLTGYMVGRIPEKGGWKDYQSYIRMVREAGHRDPLESLETISPEEMDVMRHGPEDEDIDF